MRLLFASALAMFALPAAAVEIVAHRGASEDAPENTLAAVNLGWRQQADAVEIDVALSRDGQVVVLHDEDTGRLAGRDLPVAEQTADELRRLDVGAWKDEKFRGERIPLLAEVLRTVPAGRRLLIEVKCGPEVLPAIREAFEEVRIEAARVTIIGFRLETLAAAKRTLPDVAAYWLSRKAPGRVDDPESGWASHLARAKTAGVDGIDLQAWDTIDAEFVSEVKATGLSLHVWTVDDPRDARRLAAAGVDGITTNRPGYLRRELGSNGEPRNVAALPTRPKPGT